jgi:Tol biopolymer transport system component/predicted Ser/Thr protein kinase
MSPQSIAHYRITAKLGEGGMGEVYRATDTKLGRDVAIKVLPEAFAQDNERMARFGREAQVLASLNHPNIAAIYGVEDRALVMELVEGPTLAERIAQGAIPLDEALPLIQQLIDALEYAHEKGIIHRDLKPANIKITHDGRLKVLDFGLAKALSAESGPADPAASPTLTMRATALGTILGTAGYMSPEQARGKPADRRADIWAFGVVVFEMLSGRMLFEGPTISDTLAAVLTREPDFNAVPARFRRLVRLCLAREPRQRLQAIGDARLLLDEAPTPPAAATRPSLVWMLAAGALALVAAALGTGWWRASRPMEHPLMRFSTDLGLAVANTLNRGATVSPDGSRIVYVIRNAGGEAQLATRSLNQADPLVLAGTEGADEPFFSPDSQWIGFYAKGRLRKISVQGGASVNICDTASSVMRGAAWGSDGYIVATLTSGPGGGLSRVSDAGGTPQSLTNPATKGESSHRWPQILPGGDAVLFTGNPTSAYYNDANLEILSLKTGQWKIVQRGGYYGRYLPSGHLIFLHDGALFAAPFDLDRLEVRGAPVSLIDGVSSNVTSGVAQFDFSLNGTLYYLGGKTVSGGWKIAWLDSTGAIQPLPAPAAVYVNPRVSPDGSRIAVGMVMGHAAGLAVYDWRRDTMLPVGSNRTDRFPTWTPDGKHLVFRSQSATKSALDWIRADGGGDAQRLFESETLVGPTSFSPDGKHLAFIDQNPQTGYDIWTLPLDTADPEHPKPGKAEPFLRTQAGEFSPAFSPDGHWLAYVSNTTGIPEVYVRPFPPGSGQWQVSSGGGNYPVWSSNGRELFFEAPDNRIRSSSYTAKADSFTADKPRLWSPTAVSSTGAGQHADLAPDGKRFIMFPEQETTEDLNDPRHVTVLLNFFDEVRRRVPGGK